MFAQGPAQALVSMAMNPTVQRMAPEISALLMRLAWLKIQSWMRCSCSGCAALGYSRGCVLAHVLAKAAGASSDLRDGVRLKLSAISIVSAGAA